MQLHANGILDGNNNNQNTISTQPSFIGIGVVYHNYFHPTGKYCGRVVVVARVRVFALKRGSGTGGCWKAEQLTGGKEESCLLVFVSLMWCTLSHLVSHCNPSPPSSSCQFLDSIAIVSSVESHPLSYRRLVWSRSTRVSRKSHPPPA